jgi:hypothetical protein
MAKNHANQVAVLGQARRQSSRTPSVCARLTLEGEAGASLGGTPPASWGTALVALPFPGAGGTPANGTILALQRAGLRRTSPCVQENKTVGHQRLQART